MLPWLSLALFQMPAPAGTPLERELRAQWERAGEVKGLDCAASKQSARLGFDFRYVAGIDYELGLQQFAPLTPNQRVFLLLRVTPDGRPPRYFVHWRPLPDASMIPADTKLSRLAVHAGGSVHLGEGKYKMEAMVIAQNGRGCKHHWDVEAKKTAQPLRQDPHTVESRRPTRRAAPTGEPTERVVVVLNADTWSPRRNASKLSYGDRGALLDSLGSLTDSWPNAEFSVYLVHLEQNKLLYSTPRFERGSLRAMSEALDKVDTGVIDIGSLQRGARGFFAGFIQKHAREWTGRDALIFLGPAWRWNERLPDSARKKLADLPRTYHLAMGWQTYPPDNVVKQFVSSQGGKVMVVSSPQDLARSIKRIRERQSTPAVSAPSGAYLVAPSAKQ